MEQKSYVLPFYRFAMVRASHKGCICGMLDKESMWSRESRVKALQLKRTKNVRSMLYVEKVLVRDGRMNGAVAALLLSRSRSNDQILHNESFIVSYGLPKKMSYKAPKTGFVVLVDCFRQ